MLMELLTDTKETRRSTLMELSTLLSDKERLKQVVNRNALVDCALLSVARTNAQYMANLSCFLDVGQLESDARHMHQSLELQNKKKELLR